MKIMMPLLMYEMPTKETIQNAGYTGFNAKIAYRCARNIWLRTRLSESQNWKCAWCGCVCTHEKGKKHSITIEHVIPKSMGGADDWENMVMACHSCNNNRGTMSVEDFMNGKRFHSVESVRERQKRKKLDGYAKRMRVLFERGHDIDEWMNSLRVCDDGREFLQQEYDRLSA